jgi:flagellar hook-associated protein 1 FlgK
MPISSFYGLQTSLRGLMAQQRLLDTTGHNIANASTKGYSRQEATLAASQALQIPAGGTANGAGAHIGSGVDVQSYQRVRDQFLDLQYRGQNTNLSEWKARTAALDSAELSLAEPGEDGLNQGLADFWSAWSTFGADTSEGSAKAVVVAKGSALADSIASIRAQMTAAQSVAQAEYDEISRPASAVDQGGQVAQAATQLADLNRTIAGFITAGDAPNDLMDRRDQLLDELSGYGQISVEKLATGSLNVSFVDKVTGTTYPVVSDMAATWTGPPAGDNWTPGGKLGGLLGAARSPGGTLDGYLNTLDTIAGTLATAVNGAYGGSFFTTGTPAAATLQVDPALVADPTLLTGGSGPANAPGDDIAMAVANLRGDASVDGAYKAFVAQVGSNVNESDRQQSNAQVVTDSVEDRRQSVAGVSMDEEMSNLIRFQRAYQASSRAMSTMDEMIDVLINRTGRVGL